jgi:hypothetical protein
MRHSEATDEVGKLRVFTYLRQLPSRFRTLLFGVKRPALELLPYLDEADVPPPLPPQPSSVETEAAMRRRLALVFDSGHPVENRHDLIGRDAELGELLHAALDLRQHVVLHGARGSGKTSLVRVFGDHADQRGAIVLYLSCEPSATFAEILRPYLNYVPDAALLVRRSEFDASVAALPENFSPRALHDVLLNVGGRPVIMILDELDRLEDDRVKGEIASFMKMLSDTRSSIQLLLVGIAQSVNDLIGSHPSLRRHIVTISLGRISGASVASLIDYGERESGLRFSSSARELVARAACGSPYHVRLFCQHAGQATLRRHIDAAGPTVGTEDALDGFVTALRQWSHTNEHDARRYAKLAEDRPLARSLEAIARRAAVEDGISMNDDVLSKSDQAALSSLGDSLSEGASAIGKLLFNDTVSPQFLIAAIILNEYSEADNVRPAAAGDVK